MTTAKRNKFALAERLGVFVCDLGRMPLSEYYNWVDYFSAQSADGEPVDDAGEADEAALMAAFGGL